MVAKLTYSYVEEMGDGRSESGEVELDLINLQTALSIINYQLSIINYQLSIIN